MAGCLKYLRLVVTGELIKRELTWLTDSFDNIEEIRIEMREFSEKAELLLLSILERMKEGKISVLEIDFNYEPSVKTKATVFSLISTFIKTISGLKVEYVNARNKLVSRNNCLCFDSVSEEISSIVLHLVILENKSVVVNMHLDVFITIFSNLKKGKLVTFDTIHLKTAEIEIDDCYTFNDIIRSQKDIKLLVLEELGENRHFMRIALGKTTQLLNIRVLMLIKCKLSEKNIKQILKTIDLTRMTALHFEYMDVGEELLKFIADRADKMERMTKMSFITDNKIKRCAGYLTKICDNCRNLFEMNISYAAVDDIFSINFLILNHKFINIKVV